MINFIKYFPSKYTPRKVQERILSKELPQIWEDYQTIVITIPVAGGKSLLARTIAEAALQEKKLTTATCTPTVILQNQYQEEFPELPALKGMDRYKCKNREYNSCQDRYLTEDYHCATCPYKQDKIDCLKSGIGIFNLYSYLFLKKGKEDEELQDRKDVVILDEAQSIIGQLRDLYTLKFWAHKDHYPSSMDTHGDVVVWLESQIKVYGSQLETYKTRKEREQLYRLVEKVETLVKGMKSNPGDFYYEYKKEYYRGVLKDCLIITPFTMKGLVYKLGTAKKLILMSATINNFDLEELGLSDKRVKYIEAESEIPVENRPILFFPAYKASYKTKGQYEVKLVEVLNKLLDRHKTKGLVHLTYDMIEPLKNLMRGNPRVIWHDKSNKEEMFKEFKESSDKVLMAAGMSEGIDLNGVEYEWQVITKMVFPSLADGLVKRQKEHNNKWYTWQCVKTVVQQSGRICRTPTDYGITYILDSNFIMLYYGPGKDMFPKYFKEAVSEGKKIIKSQYKGFLS